MSDRTRISGNLRNPKEAEGKGCILIFFEIVDHSTENPWLDTVNCRNGDWYEWNENTLQFLAMSYEEADDLLDKTCLIDELIEADPKETLLGNDHALERWSYPKQEKTSGEQKAKKKREL